MNTMEQFDLTRQICIITGGAGLLGKKHAEAVIDAKGIPVLIDISAADLKLASESVGEYAKQKATDVICYCADITDRLRMEQIRDDILEKYGHIDVLINNAANNPKMESPSANMSASTFETFPLSLWQDDIAVGLTGALICSQVFGAIMAKQGKGVILNISSDLGLIAPDQRIYRRESDKDGQQIYKPVTYSVIKHGLLGLTKYLATYWAHCGVRANSLCPAGVYNGHDDEFIDKYTNLLPMARMADPDEYKATILYLISDASSFMTGSTVVVDGGRTCW